MCSKYFFTLGFWVGLPQNLGFYFSVLYRSLLQDFRAALRGLLMGPGYGDSALNFGQTGTGVSTGTSRTPLAMFSVSPGLSPGLGSGLGTLSAAEGNNNNINNHSLRVPGLPLPLPSTITAITSPGGAPKVPEAPKCGPGSSAAADLRISPARSPCSDSRK